MAVVPGGSFGEYFYSYQQMTRAREANTRTYDIPVVKNKGDFEAIAKSETTGRPLFVSVNKSGYFNSSGNFIEDLKNPIYQIRDSSGNIVNDYYVDQETGNVYYRPEVTRNVRVGPISNPFLFGTEDYIGLPSATRVNGTDLIDGKTPQYIGTSFKINSVPNPEEFGLGETNNLHIENTHSSIFNFPNISANQFDYFDIEVNGVKIFSGGSGSVLNTSLAAAIVTNKDDALFSHANSFTGGATDFSFVSGNWAYNPAGFLANYGGGTASPLDEAQAYFNVRPADNFILETDVSISGNDPTGWVGVQFRSDRPSAHYTESGYMAQVLADGTVQLYKGGVGVVASVPPGTVTPIGVTPVPIQINANGSNIKVSVNGAQVIDYDDQVPFTDGYVSLRTVGHEAEFDNFEIYGYQKEIALLYNALKKGENSLVIKGYNDTIGYIYSSATSSIGGVDLSTNHTDDNNTDNSVPDLSSLNGGTPSINNILYRHSSLLGNQTAELLSNRAYWSASIQSALGIVGKIDFKNKEGGVLQKTRDTLVNINGIMQNLNSLLGADMDLFSSHLNVIR